MPTPRTALIVGNGLTLAFRGHAAPMLDAWNPSEPLNWRDGAGRPVLAPFPYLSPAIAQTNERHRAFQRIERATSNVGDSLVATELRHFLALAYSIFDARVATVPRHVWLSWEWAKFLAGVRNSLEFIVSFNYDCVLERMLDEIELAFHRVGVRVERDGVPILKPHGSIDFEVAGTGLEPSWPINAPKDLVDAPLEHLGSRERLGPRVHPELVPPHEASRIAGFQWVAPGYDEFHARARVLDQCIIVGHSHALVDRPEIYRLLGCLNPSTRIVIANTECSAELCEFALRRGHQLQWWKPGPDLAQVGHPLINVGALNRRRRTTPARSDEGRPRRARGHRPAIRVTGAPGAPPPSVHIARSTFAGCSHLLDVPQGTPVTLERVSLHPSPSDA